MSQWVQQIETSYFFYKTDKMGTKKCESFPCFCLENLQKFRHYVPNSFIIKTIKTIAAQKQGRFKVMEEQKWGKNKGFRAKYSGGRGRPEVCGFEVFGNFLCNWVFWYEAIFLEVIARFCRFTIFIFKSKNVHIDGVMLFGGFCPKTCLWDPWTPPFTVVFKPLNSSRDLEEVLELPVLITSTAPTAYTDLMRFNIKKHVDIGPLDLSQMIPGDSSSSY